MKSSELIKKLQEIDKTVPFDADVVIGGDLMPSNITNVFHDPPHTFLEPDSSQEDEIANNVEISQILENYKTSALSKENAIKAISLILSSYK